MKRRQFSAEFKAKVALEAVKGEKTIAELMAKYKVHSTQITKWKKQLLDQVPGIFSGRMQQQEKSAEKELEEAYQKIGKLQVQVDFLNQAVYRN